MDSNPLSQYFRQPAIYVRLPSGGNFYPKQALDMPPNGELPVLPMTAMDEITYRTPDALFNGSAVASVIKSCVPNILDPWSIPSIDIDTLLIAIRIASYGHELEIDSVCPNCQAESNFGLDLRTALEKLQQPDFSRPVADGDLQIFFKPMSYREMNENNQNQFEEQKMLQMMDDPNTDEKTKMTQMGQVLKVITEMAVKALAQSISMIRTPTAQVTDAAHILEWLANCDRKFFNRIRDHIIENKQKSEIQPLQIECKDCGHKYQQVYTLNMSSFFADAS